MTGKEKIIRFLEKFGPATDEEMAGKLKMNPSSVRTRRIELEREGIIEAVGYGITKSKRQTYVWDLNTEHSYGP